MLQTEKIIESINKAKDDDRKRKKAYEAEFRRKCGWGSSEGAKMRARRDVVRDDHRFRRYGR